MLGAASHRPFLFLSLYLYLPQHSTHAARAETFFTHTSSLTDDNSHISPNHHQQANMSTNPTIPDPKTLSNVQLQFYRISLDVAINHLWGQLVKLNSARAVLVSMHPVSGDHPLTLDRTVTARTTPLFKPSTAKLIKRCRHCCKIGVNWERRSNKGRAPGHGMHRQHIGRGQDVGSELHRKINADGCKCQAP